MNIQMWSIRDFAEKDFFGTLEAVAKMGYTGVEFAGYYGTSKEDLKKKLLELGLEAVSAHVGFDLLSKDLDNQIEYLVYLGAKYIVCPWHDIDTVEKALSNVLIFNEIGKKAKAAGLTFCYHNHAHEFKLDNGKYPLIELFNNVDSDIMKMEPDLYWVAHAGLDPIEFIKENAYRAPVIHFKQIKDLESKENVCAQDGIIDFKKVMEIAKDSDFIYEQEHYKGTSMEEIEYSLAYFK